MIRRPSSWRRRVMIGAVSTVAVLLAGWIWFAVAVIGHPSLTTAPTDADAIVVLGPSNQRVDQAVALAKNLGVATVVLSIGDFPEQTGTCTQPGVEVVCFVPHPYTTAGEAASIGAMAEQYGWREIIVIAAKPQSARATWLTHRCFDGDVQMVAATNSASNPSTWGWVEQSVYQSVAWVQNWFTASCDSAAESQDGRAPA